MRVRIIPVFILVVLAGCVRETYDLDKISDKGHWSPAVGISAVKGNVSIKDLIEPDDTIVFDENNLVKFVFKKDSVIDFRLADFYDLNDMISFNQTYPVGELNIAPFTSSVAFSVNEIGARFAPPVVFTDGTNPGFPSFPQTPIGEKSFSAFPNFENATFSAGTIEILVENNLPITVSGLTIRLFNSAGHTQIGSDIIISSITPGGSGIGTLNLAGLTITNSIVAEAVIHASTGTASPVEINLATTNIEVVISGRNMKVTSGRVVLPVQTISSLDEKDTVSFNPGADIEITELKILTGNLSYSLTSGVPLKATVSIILPTGLRGGNPINETIILNPASSVTGTISVDNSTFNLGSITSQPYNMLPVNYSIEVSSDGSLVTFDSNAEVSLNMELLNPEFDYAKGYFGQQEETLDTDTLDLDIKEILKNVEWDEFLVSSPSIRLNYSNSFAIPVELNLLATGKRMTSTVDLGLNPFLLSSPAAPTERDKSGVFTIDKNNSELPELVSLPPEIIIFSGAAKMNPLGNLGTRDNYIFGDSRFLGSLEVEVPLEFRMSNLQFSDTIDNFIEIGEDNSDVLSDFEYVRINFIARNGFPIGMSLSMSLYDSNTNSIKSTVTANDILLPAEVDSNGKVTVPAETETFIEVTKEFWDSVDLADKVILKFLANTTANGTKDVKIYSDYFIDFSAAVVVKADLNF